VSSRDTWGMAYWLTSLSEAHEDDAEEATQAGLALVEAVATSGQTLRRSYRFALVSLPHGGPWGDLIGEGAQGAGVIGETPNLVHACRRSLSPARC